MFDTEERGHIRAILADPESLAPRFAYANWLAAQGDSRADAVRIGTQLKARERELFDGLLEHDWRTQELRAKLKEDIGWRKRLPRVPGVAWRKAEGGLIEQVAVSDVAVFRQRAGEILDVQPVHCFETSARDERGFRTLLASPELSRLGALYLGGNYQGTALATAVAASTHLANLRCLNVSHASIGDDGAQQLAGAAHLGSLRELTLQRNDLTDRSLRSLRTAPWVAQLESLRLGWNELGPETPDTLAAVPLTNLRELDLHSNPKLTADGVVRLIESTRCGNLHWLNLAHCELAAAAGEALFSGALPRLARLNYVGNTTNQAVCAALAKCPLPDLRDLRLDLSGEIDKATSTRLAKAKWLPRLERLTIRDNGALRSMATRLAAAPLDGMEQLHWICFGTEAWSQPLDAAIGELARNNSLAHLRLLELHAPLTEASVPSLAKLTALRRLTIPSELAGHIQSLATALPQCQITKSAYVRER